MMEVICPKQTRDRIVDVTFGSAAIAYLVGGISICLMTDDIFCGSGFLMACGMSCASLGIMRNLRIASSLSDSVDIIQQENFELKASNDVYYVENNKLKETNRSLQALSEELDEDVEVLVSSMKQAGESRKDFISKLRSVYNLLKNENEMHNHLNIQQGRFQLLQLFQHFDTNNSLTLTGQEIKNSISFLTSAFPSLDKNALLIASEVSYDKLISMIKELG